MEDLMLRALSGAVMAAALCLGSEAIGQDAGTKKAAPNITVEKVFRASTIKGMKVYNLEGERVGTIDELVIDVEKGQVAYAALSVGGFLGAGDKLFAIPWRELMLEMDEKDKFFRLDIDKEKLKAAEGFDKDAWPNVADPKWAEKIESQFKDRRTTTTTKTKTTTKRDRD
jgi:sporulation protein YlmC with PRC-barrel domain